MRKPAAVAMFTSASRANRLILPRIRSETRGCVTPKSWAAWERRGQTGRFPNRSDDPQRSRPGNSCGLLRYDCGVLAPWAWKPAPRSDHDCRRSAAGRVRPGKKQERPGIIQARSRACRPAGMSESSGRPRFTASMLYGVSATDPETFVMVSGLIMAVATAACFAPAWKATRVDPMAALREQ